MKLTAPPLVNHYELERRIAVEVMGLPAVEFNDRTKCPYCGVVGRMGTGRIYCCNCSEWYYHPYKNYRDSLDDAMEVIEKLRANNWDVIISTGRGEEWIASFLNRQAQVGEDRSKSLPEAICRAALETINLTA